jgi:DNA-binding transcriptional regulator YdaS (Cro superfamily)
MNRALGKCYRICGSQVAFARLLGVTGSALNRWNKTGVPPRRVPQIVAVMNGAVTYHELRPDLYPRTLPHAVAVHSFTAGESGALVENSEAS